VENAKEMVGLSAGALDRIPHGSDKSWACN